MENIDLHKGRIVKIGGCTCKIVSYDISINAYTVEYNDGMRRYVNINKIELIIDKI